MSEENRKIDTYEQTLRRILCIFQSAESAFVCLLALIITADINEVKILFALGFDILLEVILPLIIVCTVFLGASFLSWKFEGFFLFWEWVHAIFAAFIMFVSLCGIFDRDFFRDISDSFISVVMIPVFLSWRLMTYKVLLKKYYEPRILYDDDNKK